MTDLSLDDFDDKLFLANATTEDNNNDIEDKKRYIKPQVAYVEINSSARQTIQLNSFTEYPTFTCSGTEYGDYVSLFPFYYFPDDEVTFTIAFKIKKHDKEFINFNINNIDTQDDCTLFKTIIINAKQSDLIAVGCNIESIMNKMIIKKHDNFPFTVSVHHDEHLNHDYVSMIFSTAEHYKFIVNISNVIYKNNIHCNDKECLPLHIYPNTNDYCVYLDKIYSNIKSLRIIDAYVPFSDTIINCYNNEINFCLKCDDECIPDTDTGQLIWKYFIPIGNYSHINQFIDTIESEINMMIMARTEITDTIFNFSYDKISGKFSITTAHPYTFKFEMISDPQFSNRNLYVMLGFKECRSSDHEYVHEFNNLIPISDGGNIKKWKPYRPVNLKISNYLWIKINDFENIYDTKTGKYYFSKYPINDQNPTGYIFTLATYRQLHEIHVSIYDSNGILYNTNMEENRFTLEITYYLDLLQGSSISERRGVYNSDTINVGNADNLTQTLSVLKGIGNGANP